MSLCILNFNHHFKCEVIILRITLYSHQLIRQKHSIFSIQHINHIQLNQTDVFFELNSEIRNINLFETCYQIRISRGPTLAIYYKEAKY